MFEGVCMPTAQMQQIQQQRIQAQQQAQQNAVITNLRNQIQRQANIIQDIEDAHSDDKVTVWKDAEGKFNTSRLLSDSIAGVALGTVGGAVGGVGVGVGLMELFGNRLIGGKVMGQKSLDEMELLYSQMSETERREYQAAADKLVELCDELYQKGATSPLCE